jgi:Recombinase zinc beta ribbon domain
LAAERLADNKRFAPRRTIEPSIVQGLVSCRKCGYALSRTSTRSSARKIHYYRCLGSDAWRHLGGSVCDCRPIRQDLLDQIVWREVIRLIEDPALIQAELGRRLDAARAAEPTKRRQEALERELTRIRKSIERLVTAYQEDLLPLDELRRRMPELRAREQSMRSELQAILDQAADRMSFLRLAETLTAFLQRLHESAQSLEIADRQKIVRILVKDILVDNDTITIRHSIPSHPRTPPPGTEPHSDSKSQTADQGYLLRHLRGRLPRLLLWLSSGTQRSPSAANHPRRHYLAQHLRHRALDDLVLQDEDAERPLSAVSLGDVRPANRQRLESAAMDPVAELAEIIHEPSFVGFHRHPVHPGRRLPPQSPKRAFKCLDVHVVQQRRESGLARPFDRVVHPDEMIRKIGPTLCSVLPLLVLAPHQSRPSLRSTRRLRRHPRYYASIRHPADQACRLRFSLGMQALP